MKKHLLTLLVGAALGLSASAEGTFTAGNTSFPIGETWPDTEGVHINCHGGCVVPYEGAFYWFGESRTGGHSDGISCYRSTDLYNWQKVGMAVVHQGTRDDENMQDISEGRLLERPKVVYNAATGKWVMWAHWENGNDYGQARVAILKADRITGPYTFVSTMRPNGHDSRDQTLFVDTDGNAYHFCSTDMNTNINVVRLTDDYLGCTTDETKIMRGRRLEATTVCKYADMYFATFSECNGWNPAPGHTATTYGDILDQWTEGLNFCVDPDAARSYGSQGAYVFSVASLGYDPKCMVWYGDRWNPQNVGGSTYVWLPMSIRSGYPTIRNSTGWTLEEAMRDMYRYKRADAITNGGTYSLLERNSNRMMAKLGVQAGFCLKDDEAGKNIAFVFEATDDPHVYNLRDKASGRYLAVHRTSLGMDAQKSAATLWRFFRLPDGYYNVVSEANHMALTVAGASRYDGAEIKLDIVDANAAQAFGVYFDSKTYNYKEAEHFTKAYFEAIAAEVAAQPAIPAGTSEAFEAEKPFALMHSSGLALTIGRDADRTEASIAGFENLPSQLITFKRVEGDEELYNIVDADGNYLAKDGTWTTKWGADIDPTTKEAQFTPEYSDGVYLLKCAANKLYLGTDNGNDGSAVYCNKAGGGRMLSYWSFCTPANAPRLDPSEAFQAALDQADVLLARYPASLCGTVAYDLNGTARAALQSAFDRAMALSGTIDYAAEELLLTDAIADFNENRYIAPREGQAYALRHSSGLRLQIRSNPDYALIIDADCDDNRDKFFFVTSPDDDAIALYSTWTGKLLGGGTPNRWNTYWVDESDNGTRWKIDLLDNGSKVVRNLRVNAHLGVDRTAPDSQVYCDKSSDTPYSQWTIEEVVATGVDNVSIDEDAPAEYYNLQGIRVAHPSSGIYIVRRGTKSIKILK